MYTLENEHLIININSIGAEMTKLYNKSLDLDYLWCGDARYWGRHSPILFPIVGRLMDNETQIENKLYQMSQHGFARDMKFELHNITDTSASFILNSNNDTKLLYPYDFSLIITYTLDKDSVFINWKVVNCDNNEIYFSIGAHPAFNIPLYKNESLEDYNLYLSSNKDVNQILLNGPYTDEIKYGCEINKIDLSPDLFINDALIYQNTNEICIKNNTNNRFINVKFEDFPFVGIWSPYYKESDSIAPFLCIEPWYGIADSINSDKIYQNKLGINKLEKDKSFECTYSIQIG